MIPSRWMSARFPPRPGADGNINTVGRSSISRVYKSNYTIRYLDEKLSTPCRENISLTLDSRL